MILVTGATGFIGTYLVDQLVKDGVDVLATGRDVIGQSYYEKRGIPFSKLDILKEEDFKKLPENIDAIVHLAALLRIDAWSAKDYLMTNSLGTYNVLEYCRKNDIKKVVYSMTHSDINRTKDLIITENTPREFGGPSTAFIVSKVAAVNIIESYTREYGIHGIILRLPGIRGYGCRFIGVQDGKFIEAAYHKFIRRASEGKPIEIWSHSDAKRDMTYIKDVVRGIVCALNAEDAVGLYNIGTGIGVTIEDEAKAIIKVFSPPNNPSEILYRPDIEGIQRRGFIYDISKAKRDLGYYPKFSCEDALKDYKKEMESGKFRYLVLRQEAILKNKYGKNLKDVLDADQ